MTLATPVRLAAPADDLTEVDLSDDAIVPRLDRFLSSVLGVAARAEGFRRFTGGLSWITAAFTLRAAGAGAMDGRALIVKIGSRSGLMAPYSSLPQARVLAALEGGLVPVPRLHWSSDDETLLGAPFLITDRVEGDELNPFVRDYNAADASVLAPLGLQLARVLADLHRFDWRGAGIDNLQGERTDAPAGAEQAAFWLARIREWCTEPTPLLDHAAAWLVRHAPVAPRMSIVHGDYRVGNFLARGTVLTTMLDWEMTHLGDPHEDIAWVLLPEMRLAGLIGRDDFISCYERASGIHVDRRSLAYYNVFSIFKMAAINTGGQAGFRTGDHDPRLACLAFNVPMYLDRLARALEAWQ